MHERLKRLRKSLDLTQQEFANKIGMKRNTVANYETHRNEPSAAVVSLICREFNVNEDWLRTGNGDMILPVDRNTEISKLTQQLLNEESNSFKNRFVSMLANLTVDEWEFLEDKAKELCGVSNETAATSQEINSLTREEPHTELNRQLNLEARAEEKSEVLRKSG